MSKFITNYNFKIQDIDFLNYSNFLNLCSKKSSNTNIKYLYAMKNSVQLIGHVGQEPEIKNLEGGKKLANISIATNEVYYRENGDKVEQTQWHRVTAWGKTADIIERFVTKGKEIGIEGKLTHRSYDDKDGNKRYVTEVIANEILLIGK